MPPFDQAEDPSSARLIYSAGEEHVTNVIKRHRQNNIKTFICKIKHISSIYNTIKTSAYHIYQFVYNTHIVHRHIKKVRKRNKNIPCQFGLQAEALDQSILSGTL